MEWCQEDVDELFVAFEKNSTLPVEELLRCITQDISDKNIHKSEQEVGFFHTIYLFFSQDTQITGILGYTMEFSGQKVYLQETRPILA